MWSFFFVFLLTSFIYSFIPVFVCKFVRVFPTLHSLSLNRMKWASVKLHVHGSFAINFTFRHLLHTKQQFDGSLYCKRIYQIKGNWPVNCHIVRFSFFCSFFSLPITVSPGYSIACHTVAVHSINFNEMPMCLYQPVVSSCRLNGIALIFLYFWRQQRVW